MYRILVVDDDQGIRELFQRLYGTKHSLTMAATGAEALTLLADEPFDLVICDLSLPDLNGIAVLQASKKQDIERPVFVITAYGTVDSAVEAMKHGAMDYLAKPLVLKQIDALLERALAMVEREQERVRLKRWADSTYSFSNIIGKSEKMQKLFDMVRRVADTPATVLIQGASGTGKELIARAIHQNSSRRSRNFVAINCAALPESLLESELFGHVKGAFTGAMRSKKGLFEEASGGSIFLDEIGTVSPAVQAKLLRVLQEREVRPVGGNQSIPVDTRVIAATNEDLRALVDAGRIREDLYFRLSVIPLVLPPLRDRKEDIPLLVAHFAKLVAERTGQKPKQFSSQALAALLDYRWPGNVRELENLIERMAITVESPTVEHADLPEEIRGSSTRHGLPELDALAGLDDPENFDELKSELERRRLELDRAGLLAALRLAGGNRSKAAKALGISRGTLYNLLHSLERHGLILPESSAP